MTTRVAISQSNYIPWKGYFDLIASVDVFVIYDDMQYTKRDWRNRNKIKTPAGLHWLTIPVQVKGKYYQPINEVQIADSSWQEAHWNLISQNYKSARFFEQVSVWLKPFFENNKETYLSSINRAFIELVCEQLKIQTKILDSRDFDLSDGKSERLADICLAVEGDEYISGPAAKNYIDDGVFQTAGLSLRWADYGDYPEYDQLWGKFEHSVTILDLFFNAGENAANYMKYVK